MPFAIHSAHRLSNPYGQPKTKPRNSLLDTTDLFSTIPSVAQTKPTGSKGLSMHITDNAGMD